MSIVAWLCACWRAPDLTTRRREAERKGHIIMAVVTAPDNRPLYYQCLLCERPLSACTRRCRSLSQ